MTVNNPRSLTSGSEMRAIIRLAIPSMVGLLGIFSFNIADAFFVAQLGGEELTAISFTFPVAFFFIAVNIALGISASSTLSRVIGQGKRALACSCATHNLLFALLVSVLMVGAGLLTIEPLFRFMGAEGRILKLICDYMLFWYISAIFLTFPIVGNNLLRADNHAIFPGVIMVVSSLLNIALDPILIFGLWGAPALGIEGAGIATLIARVFAFILCISYLHYHARLVDWGGRNLHLLWPDWKNMIHIAIPAGLENSILPVIEWILVILLARFGPEAVATYGVISRIWAMLYVPYIGLSTSLIPFSGQNWGAGNITRITRAFYSVFALAVGWCFFSAIIVFFTAEKLVRFFTEEAVTIAWAMVYLKFVPITYFGSALVFIISSVFYGMAKPGWALALPGIQWVIIYLPLVFWAATFRGVEQILTVEILSNILGGIVGFWVFWEALKIRPPLATSAPRIS